MRKSPDITQDEYERLSDFERKQLPTFVKSFDEEQGIVEHFVAIMGNVDEGNDRIIPGAFIKSINDRGKRVKVLDQHSTDSVTRIVGRPLELREVSRDELTPEVLSYAPDATGGLLAKTQYAIDTTRGRDIFNLVKGGYAPESSIGYDALQTEETKERGPDGKTRTIRNLKQIRLWEYSSVIWGMNPATSVVSAKGTDTTPAEAKPYQAIHEGDKWEVYKLDSDGKPTGSPLGTHDSQEEANQQIAALYANEDKAGRVLNARNMARIQAAMKELNDCLMEAGMMNEDDDKNGATGPQKFATSPTSDAQEAGPNSDDSTRLKTLIQIEQEALKLMEVQNWTR